MCTLFARADRERRWVLASTSDDPYAVGNQLVCGNGGRYRYLAVRVAAGVPEADVPWDRMLTRGINAAGFAYTYAYVHEPGAEACPAQEWAQDMLAHCRTVEEAVVLIRAEL